jgi:hypothetical protein
MLPNRIPEPAMSDVRDTNGNGTERTSEPHIVVACPSCCTKFAIESSLVASYEVPRFHCSRCDAIFELQQQQAPVSTATPSQRWVLDDTTQKAPRNDDASSSVLTQTPLKSTDFTLGTIPNPDTFEPRAEFEPIENRAGLSILGFRPTASRRHSSSLTRSEAQSLAAAPPLESPRRQPAIEQSDPFALFDAPDETPAPGPALGPAPGPALGTVQTSPPTSPSKGMSIGNHSHHPQPIKHSNATTSRAEPLTASVQHSASNVRPPADTARRFFSRLSERTQGLVRLSIPVMVTIGILTAFSVATRFMPLTMDSVFGAVVPGFIAGRAAHLPPPEISVQDLNLHLEKTQSKETLPVIRGFVNNSSESTFEDVSIEALGFNARGELLVRARAPLRSALSREKISDLPLETVKKFQNALSASDASIKGGEKVAFSVALFLQDAAPQEVTYFSARVFSVGRTR